MDLHTLTLADVYVQGVPRQALRRVDAVHPVRILALSIRNCATGRRGWPPAGGQMGSDRRSYRIVKCVFESLEFLVVRRDTHIVVHGETFFFTDNRNSTSTGSSSGRLM